MDRAAACLVSSAILAVFVLEAADCLGAGGGPGYVGGSDAGQDGDKWAQDTYKQYITYKRLMQLNTEEDEIYYSRFTLSDYCEGSCPHHSHCTQGVCMCDTNRSYSQKYGQCFPHEKLSGLGNKEKYRKPDPPPKPMWCFCEDSWVCGKLVRKVCEDEEHKNSPYCKDPVYPDYYHPTNKTCVQGDHQHCLSQDINMVCGEGKSHSHQGKNMCECRKDMKFDTVKMECRLYIDVDCTDVIPSETDKTSNLTRLFTGEIQEPDKQYTQTEITSAFCNLLHLSEMKRKREVEFLNDLDKITGSIDELKSLLNHHIESDHSSGITSYLYLDKDRILQLPTFEELPCHQEFPDPYIEAGVVVPYEGTDTLMVCRGDCFVWLETGWEKTETEIDRYSHSSSMLPDGRWLMSGGKYHSWSPNSEFYTTSTLVYADGEGFTDYHPLPEARSRACQVTVGEVVYNIGGKLDVQSWQTKASGTVYVSSHNQSWTDLVSDLETPRYRHACAVFGGNIYVIGGTTDDNKDREEDLSSVEILDPANPSQWGYGPELPEAARYAQAVVYESVLYVLTNLRGPDGMVTRVFSLAQGAKEWEVVANIPPPPGQENQWRSESVRAVFPAPVVQAHMLHCNKKCD